MKRHILELFRRQIAEGLAFLGAKSIHELDPVVRATHYQLESSLIWLVQDQDRIGCILRWMPNAITSSEIPGRR